MELRSSVDQLVADLEREPLAATSLMLHAGGLVLRVARLRAKPHREAPAPPPLAGQAQQMLAALDGIERSMRKAGEIAAELANADAGPGAAPRTSAARRPLAGRDRAVK